MKIRMILFLAFVIAFQLCAQNDPDPNRFIDTIQSFRNWDSKNAIPQNPVLFVGSSSIRMWKTAESFADLPVMNRGFGGAHISDMLYFKKDILLKYSEKPTCVVMYCGGNDVAGGKSADRVFADFQEWWDVVQGKFPGTPLIYIAIKPCPNRWNIWETERAANLMIQDFCEENDLLYYADIAAPMLQTGQPPAQDLFLDDELHMSAKGYEMWTGVVRPIIDQIIRK